MVPSTKTNTTNTAEITYNDGGPKVAQEQQMYWIEQLNKQL